MNNFSKKSLSIFLFFSFFSCQKNSKLPILGQTETQTKIVNGNQIIDSVYHTIPAFSFTDQNNQIIDNKTFKDKKIYISDFFFTSCPTICPKMKTQMLRLYNHFKGNESVCFLSHTIDPRHDTVPVLSEYGKKLGVTGNQWHFVTGAKEKIYEVALKGYMATAQEDSTAEGGFVHSGAFILVDKLQRVRGIYDGTNKEEVDKLQEDIETLLAEYK